MTDDEAGGFRARPRRDGDGVAQRERLLAELARVGARLKRATDDGVEAFLAAESDSHDIGMLAIINLADLVVRELPDQVTSTLPPRVVEGLRATRNIAAHNYAALDNKRLWLTITVHAPKLIDELDAALRNWSE